jgi:hypothetical protein
VTRIGALGTRLAVTSNRRKLRSTTLVTLMVEALSSSETSVLTRATRRNVPEDAIIHSHRRENLKSYIQMKDLNVFKIHNDFTGMSVYFKQKRDERCYKF